MTAVRVFVATTEGPSEVQRIAEEDPEVRSVVCLNGTSEALPISAAYDSFVRKPTGVIERLFGHPVFRLDVAERIGDGRSWQLGFAVAHALHAGGRLAERGTKAQTAVWLTGTVDNDLNVGPVDHVPEKLRRSAPLFAELRSQGIPVTVVLPQENLKEAMEAGAHEGIRVVPADRLAAVFRKLGLPWTEPVRPKRRRKARLPLIAAILLAAGAAAAGIGNRQAITTWWEGAFGESPAPAPVATEMPSQPTVAAELPPPPETVPAVAVAQPEPAAAGPDDTAEAPVQPDPGVEDAPEPPIPSVVETPEDGEQPANAQTSETEAEAPDAGSEVPAQSPAATEGPEGRATTETPPETAAPQPTAPAPAEPQLSAQDIHLGAIEQRAPGARSCAVANFGNRGPEEFPIGMESPRQFATSRAQGLCSVAYRIDNGYSKDIRLWVYAAPIGERIGFGATESASAGRVLHAGEAITVELQLPRWVRQTVRHRVIVVATEAASTADLTWIDRGMAGIQSSFDFARWAELRERILADGLILISAIHEITP